LKIEDQKKDPSGKKGPTAGAQSSKPRKDDGLSQIKTAKLGEGERRTVERR